MEKIDIKSERERKRWQKKILYEKIWGENKIKIKDINIRKYEREKGNQTKRERWEKCKEN